MTLRAFPLNRNKAIDLLKGKLYWARGEKSKDFFEFIIINAFPTSVTFVCFAYKFKTSSTEFLKKFKEERRVNAFSV